MFAYPCFHNDVLSQILFLNLLQKKGSLQNQSGLDIKDFPCLSEGRPLKTCL